MDYPNLNPNPYGTLYITLYGRLYTPEGARIAARQYCRMNQEAACIRYNYNTLECLQYACVCIPGYLRVTPEAPCMPQYVSPLDNSQGISPILDYPNPIPNPQPLYILQPN